MDKIRKIISLEQAKNRTQNKLPFYYVNKDTNTCEFDENTGETNLSWGGYCVDILIPEVGNQCDEETPCIPSISWVKDTQDSLGLERYVIQMQPYELLPYIEGTGKQYIELDYYPNGDTEIECDLMKIVDENYDFPDIGGWYFCSRERAGVKQYGYLEQTNRPETGSWRYGSSSNDFDRKTVFGRIQHIKTDSNLYLDGIKITNVSKQTFTSPYKMLIFGGQDENGINYCEGGGRMRAFEHMRLYNFTVSEHGTKLIDLVPARRLEDGKIGMYDKINETFYVSIGTEDFITDGIPTGDSVGVCEMPVYWARYKNLMREYHWLVNDFLSSLSFYKMCQGNAKPVIIRDKTSVFTTDMQIFETLDEAESGVTYGEIFGVSDLYDEFMWKFKSKTNAKNFIDFVQRLVTEGLFYPMSGTTPYMDFTFSITSNQTDMGLMSPFVKEWVPKKKYYLGEVVLNNNKTYQLRKCNHQYDKYLLTGSLLDEILAAIAGGDDRYALFSDESELPDSLFNLNISTIVTDDGEQIDYVFGVFEDATTDVPQYYLIQPYYGGYVDSNLVPKMDDETKSHWHLYTNNTNDLKHYFMFGDSGVTYNVIDPEWQPELPELTGITESKLVNLKRKVTSVDDFGNQLPFIIPQGSTGGDTELTYLLGVTNEQKYDNNELRGDCLLQIRYRETEDDEWEVIEVTSSANTISSDAFSCDSGVVEFTYLIGCQIGTNMEPVSYTGVKYTEEWLFNKLESTYRIDGDNCNFKYINLTPKYFDEYGVNNVDIDGKTPIYSLVTYYGKEIAYANAIYAPYYKEEDLLGVQDVNTLDYDSQYHRYVTAIDANIERGMAAAFEKHNILGEIKTFSDLENYRNNFFQI